MVSARWRSVVQIGALVVLWLFACAFIIEGLLGSVFRWLLPSRTPIPPLQLTLSIIIFFTAAFIGVAVILRFRVAAILLSVWFAFLCGEEIYGMMHGFSLPQPPHISGAEMVGTGGVGLLPALLTALAWKRLR